MRFLSMIRVDETTGQQPSQRLMDEMMALIGELSAAGVLLDTAGLLPSSHGARVRSQHGRITVTDGPFAEAREVIGGYAILKAQRYMHTDKIFELTHIPLILLKVRKPMMISGMQPRGR